MRSPRPATCIVVLLLSASLARSEDPAPPATDAPPMSEAAYREAAGRWNETWRERPSLTRNDEESCIAAWQTGERVRVQARPVTPPGPYAAYHTALLECIDASLAVSDECLLKPRGGPKWMPYRLAARKKCLAVSGVVNDGKLDLPRSW